MEELCSDEVVSSFATHPKVLEGFRSRRFVLLKCVETGFEIHVFRGVERDYVVVPCRWCSCYDFVINVLSRRIKSACYHVVGFELARRLGKLYVVEVPGTVLKEIVIEIMSMRFSPTLRKILSGTRRA